MVRATVDQPANSGSHCAPSAAMAALNTSDTINRNPMPRIIPNDTRRTRTMFHKPAVPALGGARQIRSKASCNSAKTVVAPMKRRRTPKNVARRLSPGLPTLSRRSSTAVAPFTPSSSWSCS